MYFKHICNTFGKRMPWCFSSWKTTNWLLWKVTMTLIRLVITTCWQDWSALISGKQKLDQRKTMQNWNCRAPQELQFGKAHIIAFSQNNKRSICDFSTGSFLLFCHIHKCVSFPFPPIQTFWHICSIGNAFSPKVYSPHSIWIVTWIKIPPSFPFSAILCRVLLQNSLSSKAHQHFQNLIVVVLVSNQAQENGDWLTRSGNMMESFSMELRCWPR